MLLKSGSILADGSALTANSRNDAGVEVTGQSLLRLLDLSVLTVKDASTAIVIADAALADLERIRAEAGAYQGQFESSISLLGETEMHVSEARSKMIEVDFANEVENLTRMQLLVQSSAFALTQANATPENVFRILQGGADQKFTDFFISATSRSMFDN
jgi:flagellin